MTQGAGKRGFWRKARLKSTGSRRLWRLQFGQGPEQDLVIADPPALGLKHPAPTIIARAALPAGLAQREHHVAVGAGLNHLRRTELDGSGTRKRGNRLPRPC